MKTKDDPRHRQRVKIMQALFQNSFNKTASTEVDDIVKEIHSKQARIDKLISKNATAWPIEQIGQVDLATLRLSIWELLYKKDKEPYKAIVDEAVEIAKEYGTDASATFVNGVLGTVIKSKLKLTINNEL